MSEPAVVPRLANLIEIFDAAMSLTVKDMAHILDWVSREETEEKLRRLFAACDKARNKK